MPGNQEWNSCFSRLESLLKRPISQDEQDGLQAYVSHLLKWNKTYNLIGPSTVTTVLERHIVDSTPLLPLLPDHAKIADIGSGAGFPGLVLAILSKPPTQISLIESAGKKARFLQYIVNQLALSNRCTIFSERAEKHSLNKNNEYHFVVSRAVGTLSLLAKLSVDLLQPGGSCLALKGERSESEIIDFLKTPLKNSFELPIIIPVAEIPGATIIKLKKVSRET
jgi:16S rRNA (guanine527-N7)-methyltransferase